MAGSKDNGLPEQTGVRRISVSALQTDARNANKGTVRGRGALEASLREYGAGRSILVDREGRVIAGNKTLTTAAEIGLTDVVVVQTDGKQIVAVQRMDLDAVALERLVGMGLECKLLVAGS